MINHKQKGTSTVEFALMLPILLLLVFAVSEFGVMFYQLNALNKSVQVAARYLSDVTVNHTISSANKTTAQNLAVYGNSVATGTPVLPNFAPGQITVSPPAQDAYGYYVQITANYTANFIMGGTLDGILELAAGGSVATGPCNSTTCTLTATSIMRLAQ